MRLIKRVIKRLLLGIQMPVLRGNLKGLKLRGSALLKLSIIFRNYEPEKQALLKKIIAPGEVFFDIGANVGIHSLFISRTAKVQIFSFEPLPQNAEYIERVVKDNNIRNITVHQLAISSKNGDQYFDLNGDNSKGSLSKGNSGLRVQVMTLDNFCYKNGVFPNVIKVDVEGFESEVLDGSTEVTKQFEPIFVIELHNPEQDKKVGIYFSGRPYELYRLEGASNSLGYSLHPIKSLTSYWPDPNGVWGDVVAIPKSKLRKLELSEK